MNPKINKFLPSSHSSRGIPCIPCNKLLSLEHILQYTVQIWLKFSSDKNQQQKLRNILRTVLQIIYSLLYPILNFLKEMNVFNNLQLIEFW